MRNKKLAISGIIFVLFFLYALFSSGNDQEKGLAEATFYVQWYTVGKAALEGLPGVKKVETGFSGFKEIDRVYYDPEQITIKEMTKALKKAGTYRGIKNKKE